MKIKKNLKKKNEIVFIKGKNIFLRPFLKEDLTKKYLKFINSEINSFLETGKIPVNEKDLENYYNENQKSKNSILFAVCDMKSNHIGNCSLTSIDWINRRCSYGRLIWGQNKKKRLGTEVLKLLQKYVFETLNLNSMYCGVVSINKPSVKSNINSGMKIVGKYEEAYFRNNKYYDFILFSITKKQYLNNIKIDKI